MRYRLTVLVASFSSSSSSTVSILTGLGFFASASGTMVCGRADRVLKVLRAGLVRDDRQAFGNRRADAARMIEVVVAVDDVRQRLVRLDLSRLGDDGQRSSVVLRRLDQRHVVRELDEHAVMAPAGEPPDARRDFLRR